MNKNIDWIINANIRYANVFGEKAELPILPARKLAILTCMDARLDPMGFAGLKAGDAHIVRNAGGRASEDAIRSLIVSNQILCTNEWLVIHHTDCGMETLTNEKMRESLKQSFNTDEGDRIDWMAIGDRIESVKDDVTRLRNHPLVPGDVAVSGYLFDVKTGLLTQVIKA